MQQTTWFDTEFMDRRATGKKNKEKHAADFAKSYANVSTTENGAAGLKTTGHALLNLNFETSSLRNRKEEVIIRYFIKAYHESPRYAMKWLFYLRDAREGLGERRTFRICLKYLAETRPDVARAVLALVPEYGRYDDALVLLDTPLAADVAKMYKSKLNEDLQAKEEGRPISLLAKWLPSVNTSSAATRQQAKTLCLLWHMPQRRYRQTLSKLRAYGNVVETKLSASRWSDVDYASVPAKANLKYDETFARRDRDRRAEYLRDVVLGNEKLNAAGLMPCDVVHRMLYHGKNGLMFRENLLSNLMWEKLQAEGFQNDWDPENTLVVADGSGSMYCRVSDRSELMAIEICNSLAIYCAERLRGAFRNRVITFSRRPQFVDLKEGSSLRDKLEILFAHNEVANTDIEAVFDLVLEMAKCENVPREELPRQILIISDMEFDMATETYHPEKNEYEHVDRTLFETIREKYEAAGYRMPRLIFWNICGRTGTVPMAENEQGVCLLSGFSQNAARIAAAADRQNIRDPYEALIAVLDSPRYQAVEDALDALGAA